MAKSKNNFYAIHYIGTGENVIVKTWAECQKKTKGRANRYRGFITEEEANKLAEDLRAWLARENYSYIDLDCSDKERINVVLEKLKEMTGDFYGMAVV